MLTESESNIDYTSDFYIFFFRYLHTNKLNEDFSLFDPFPYAVQLLIAQIINTVKH